MKPDLNTIVLVIAALVIAGGAYWYFFTDTGNDAPVSATASQSAAQEKFKNLVSQLRGISFNTSIFSDARFNSLVDITVPMTAEPIGRPDPFAAIAGVSVSTE